MKKMYFTTSWDTNFVALMEQKQVNAIFHDVQILNANRVNNLLLKKNWRLNLF